MIYCGIDVAKLKHAISLMDEKGQILKAASIITNNRSDLDQLHKGLQSVGRTVTVGWEVTCHCWLALYDDLTRNHYPVIVLNPLQVAAYRKSGNRMPAMRSGLPITSVLPTYHPLSGICPFSFSCVS